MKKVIYILKNWVTDTRENIRIIIFSIVIVFISLFYISDNNYYESKMSLLSGLSGTYYYTCNNDNLTSDQVEQVIGKYGKSHNVVCRYVSIDDGYSDCFICDDYIMKHINYALKSGMDITNTDQVIISSKLGEKYDVGDTLSIAISDDAGNITQKEKVVCGILKENYVYYPNAIGDDIVDLLFAKLDGELYSDNAIISIDQQLDMDKVVDCQAYLLEVDDDFDEKSFDEEMEKIGDWYTGEEIIKDNRQYLDKTKSKDRIIVLAGLIIGLSTFLGSIYISDIRRRREKGVLMLCGASKYEAVCLIKANGVISNIIGSIIGSCLACICVVNKIFESKLLLWHCLCVIGGVLLIYVICEVIINLCHAKESAIELVRKEI